MRHVFSFPIFLCLSIFCVSGQVNDPSSHDDQTAIVRGSNPPPVVHDTDANGFKNLQKTNAALAQEKEVLQETTGSTIVLMDAETGAVLGGRGERTSNWIASTTKLMTLLLAREYDVALDDIVTVEASDTPPPGSSLAGLRSGMVLTMTQIAEGLMIPSGNDAGMTIARYIGGQYICGTRQGTYDYAPCATNAERITRFVQRMNDRCAELGCVAASFANPHGFAMYTTDRHFASAYDMASVMRALVKYADVVPLMRIGTGQLKPISGGATVDWKGISGATTGNTSGLLCYPGVLAVKQGWMWGGRNFFSNVVYARRGATSLIVAALNYPTVAEMEAETKTFLDMAFPQNNGCQVIRAVAACEEVAAQFSYSGTWWDSSPLNRSYSGGFAKYGTSAGASGTVVFWGTAVDIYLVKGPDLGQVGISIDGGIETLHDMSHPTYTGQLGRSVTGLAPGRHVARIRSTGVRGAYGGGTALEIDKIVVTE